MKSKSEAQRRLLHSAVFCSLCKEAEVDVGSMVSSAENGENRKQDLHELDLQFAREKHELELKKLQLDIDKDQIEFQMKMREMEQKQQEQAMQSQQPAETEAMPEGPPPVTDATYKGNIVQAAQMGKAGAYEDQYIHGYGEKVPFEGKVKPMAVGAGLGVLGAQLLPTDPARALFDQASDLPKGSLGKLPLRAKGFGANIRRTGLGAGAGVLAGLLAHEIFD